MVELEIKENRIYVSVESLKKWSHLTVEQNCNTEICNPRKKCLEIKEDLNLQLARAKKVPKKN